MIYYQQLPLRLKRSWPNYHPVTFLYTPKNHNFLERMLWKWHIKDCHSVDQIRKRNLQWIKRVQKRIPNGTIRRINEIGINKYI